MKLQDIPIIRLCLLAILLYPNTALISQVTIGSGIAPVPGALLDLKEWQANDGSANSTRGVLLPRVKLETPISLAPIVDENANKLDYAGLMVANVSGNEAVCNLMGFGIYTWDGASWHNLSPQRPVDKTNWKENPDGVTGVLTDYEGNTYTAKKFGNTWWTTQNSKSTLSNTGDPLYDPNDTYAPYGARLNPAINSDILDGAIVAQCTIWDREGDPIGYLDAETNPGMGAPNNQSDSRSDFATKFGLAYTGELAQDACPRGWKLPNNSDWENLQKTLDPSGTIQGPTTNKAGAMMRANKNFFRGFGGPGIIYPWGGNDPIDTDLVGFGAYPAGMTLEDGKFASGFGYAAYWWSSDFSVWMLTVSQPAIQKTVQNKYYYMSIRCVKN